MRTEDYKDWKDDFSSFELNDLKQSGNEVPYLATKTQIGGTHYKGLAIEPGYYAQVNQLNYMEANVLKYITRHRHKGGAEDINKAIHCLTLLLQWEYSHSPNMWRMVP